MSLKDLIAAAFNKDASSFESAFSSVMQEKVAAGLQSRFSAVAEEVDLDEAKKDDEEDDEDEDDEDEMCEDVDQIDELSKATLGRYINKASANKGMHDRTVGRTSDKDSKEKSNRRAGGITVAAGKLSGAPYVGIHAKEEVEALDELSKNTLGSYVKKASQHSAEVAHAMGKQKADRDDVARFTNRNGMANKQKVRDDLEKSLGADYETERKNRKTFNKRSTGIDRAVDKLSK